MLLFLVALCWLSQPSSPITVYHEVDGTQLMLVPAGDFQMGSSPKVAEAAWQKVKQDMSLEDLLVETPGHPVQVSSFYLGRTEVTCAQFRAFVQATGYDAGEGWKTAAAQWGEQSPVVSVSWNDARAYCDWAGLRLPSEEEWERAAGSASWPWGDVWQADACRSSVGGAYRSATGPCPVGSFPQGASHVGCLDMAGNVCEWTDSRLSAYPGNQRNNANYARDVRVVRGGSWRDNSEVYLRNADRWWQTPDQRNDGMGFRCARDL